MGTRAATVAKSANDGLRPGRLRVAMIGQKGIPATHGGVERHVEQLGALLAEQDDLAITVYCRRGYGTSDAGRTYRGIRLVRLPTFRSKHLDAISHSLISTLHAMVTGADIIHYHALGPGLVAPMPRYLSRSRVVLTVHGLDNERAKWGGSAQRVLDVAYRMSGRVPDRVITVSRALTQRYREDLGCDAVHIPNGVEVPEAVPFPERLREEFGLEPGRFVLFIGRLVPEKRPDLLIEALTHISADVKVAIVGGSSFTDDYLASLRRLAAGDPRVVFTGYLYGQELAGAYAHAAVFVQPSDLEGLPLTLLEAVAAGVPVLASDIAPHVEIIGGCRCGAHRIFAVGDAAGLGTQLAAMLDEAPRLKTLAGAEAPEIVAPYDWRAAAAATADVYRSIAPRRRMSQRVGGPRTQEEG